MDLVEIIFAAIASLIVFGVFVYLPILVLPTYFRKLLEEVRRDHGWERWSGLIFLWFQGIMGLGFVLAMLTAPTFTFGIEGFIGSLIGGAILILWLRPWEDPSKD